MFNETIEKESFSRIKEKAKSKNIKLKIESSFVSDGKTYFDVVVNPGEKYVMSVDKTLSNMMIEDAIENSNRVL